MSSNLEINETLIDVLGIGNAIVDVLIQVEDSFLKEHSLEKGSMTLISEEQAEELSLKITRLKARIENFMPQEKDRISEHFGTFCQK